MQPPLIAPGIAVVVLGTAIGVQQGWPAYRDSQTKSWPHVDGRITESNAAVYNVGLTDRRADYWMPNVRYEYTVNGQLFTGTTIAYGRSFSRKRAVEFAERFHPGTKVTVYYDPKIPSHAVLERGAYDVQILYAGIGAATVLIGALILAAALG
jgi:Protein of unknown function (DUF3592)